MSVGRKTAGMKFCLAAAVAALAMGCATNDSHQAIATHVVTFPDGALVEFNGEPKGRAPAEIILPQDEFGRLTEEALVRAIPNTKQGHLYAQERWFAPAERQDRVPHKIMIDMTLRGTNTISPEEEMAAAVPREETPRQKHLRRIPHTQRSKPTQAVGIDRWNPGKY